ELALVGVDLLRCRVFRQAGKILLDREMEVEVLLQPIVHRPQGGGLLRAQRADDTFGRRGGRRRSIGGFRRGWRFLPAAPGDAEPSGERADGNSSAEQAGRSHATRDACIQLAASVLVEALAGFTPEVAG